MRLLLLLAAVLACARLGAAELMLDDGDATRTRDTASLLADPHTRTIDVPADVAYARPMRYRAIPLADLLGAIDPDIRLQFVALDGFVAELRAAALLSRDGARAWLAIEDPATPWPALGHGKEGSAGPFYLVWTDPARGGIVPEQWPYQVGTIRRVDAIAARYPMLAPAKNLPTGHPARRGFAQFHTHCLACHTLNRQGDARLGPDLNVPRNPLEYFGEATLRAYVRDPQSLRYWPQARMPAFTPQILPDAALDDVIAYLRHMSTRKVDASPADTAGP